MIVNTPVPHDRQPSTSVLSNLHTMTLKNTDYEQTPYHAAEGDWMVTSSFHPEGPSLVRVPTAG